MENIGKESEMMRGTVKHNGFVLVLAGMFCFWSFCVSAGAAEELYIITARDGSARIVQDYRFTEQHVEFTTEEGASGFISREDFVKIENMVGVPPSENETGSKLVTKVKQMAETWLFPAIIAALVFIIIMVLQRIRKKSSYPEVMVRSNGHLAFEYKQLFGRSSKWTIDVRSGYKVGDTLYFEGFCITTNKLKRFSADRVVGLVTDVSNGHQAPIKHFFVEADNGR